MKKKSGKRRRNKFTQKKFLSAFLLGLLVVTGGAAALPFAEGVQVSGSQFYGDFKQVQNNPLQFINAENLALPKDFDYFRELNRDFADDFPDGVLFDERDLDDAIREDDYEKWTEAFVETGGSEKSGIVSKEEFEILRELKKLEEPQ